MFFNTFSNITETICYLKSKYYFLAEVISTSKLSEPRTVYIRVQLLEHGWTSDYLYREYKERQRRKTNDLLFFSPNTMIYGRSVAFLIYSDASEDSKMERLKVLIDSK